MAKATTKKTPKSNGIQAKDSGKKSKAPTVDKKAAPSKSAPAASKKSKKAPSPSSSSSSSDSESDSDSDSSSSESEAEEKEPVKGAKPAKVAKKVAADSSSDSSSSDSDSDSSSSSEDEKPAKPVKEAAKKAEKVVKANGKAAVEKVKEAVKEDSSSDSSDSDSDSDSSDSDSDAPAPKANGVVKAAATKVAKGAEAVAAKAKEVAKDDSSDDSSDSDSESDDDSSSSSSSSDDDEDAEMKDAAPVSRKRSAEESSAPAKKAKTEAAAPAGASSTIYVGGLSWNVDNDWLKSEFETVGEVVSARVVTDRDSGKSRGFGYVEFTKPESAQKALEMAGHEIDGRAIKVDVSTPRPARENATPQDRKKTFNDQLSGPPTTTLFVGNLPFSASEDAVWTVFADFGDVSSVRLPTDKETGRPKGFGYIEFSSIEGAQAAVAAGGPEATGEGVVVEGRTVRLDYSQPRDQSSGGGGGGRGGFGGGRGGARGGGMRGGGRGGGFGGGRGGGFGGGRGGGRGGASSGRGRDQGWASRGNPRSGGATEFKGNKKTFD